MSRISIGRKSPLVNRLNATNAQKRITRRGTGRLYTKRSTTDKRLWFQLKMRRLTKSGILTRMDSGTRISIVVPAFNEEENLPVLLQEIEQMMAQHPARWEVLLVDDGSTDSTLEVMMDLKHKVPAVRVLALRKNHGLSAALDAGFRNATGDVIVSLDADLQNDPSDIPKLLEKLPEYDAVIGIRVRRKDNFVKRRSSRIANGIRDLLLQEKWRDTGCTLKAYKRSYLEKIKLFHGLHRFLPTLLLMENARILEVPVNHRERIHGQSKYHLWNRLTGPLRDLLAVRWMKQRHFTYDVEEK
jgi:dolichol-phosphate mannosyltransferase